MASNSQIHDFLGGSPLQVLVKLLFVSLVVGALLMWLEIEPMDLVYGARRLFDRISSLGFGAVHTVLGYVITGAIIVVPIWLVLRLLSAGRR